MSDLDNLKEKQKVKRFLKNIHFDFDGAHVALTDASQGGACSMLNEPLLLKALKGKTLTEEQRELLEKMGHDISEIEKSASEKQDSSSSLSEENDEEVNTNINKENEDIMSEDIQKRLAALEKENKILKTQGLVSKYNFEADVEEALVEAIHNLENQEAVVKAFDAILDSVEEAVSKAKEKQEEIPENDLAKKLQEEIGTETKEDEEVEKAYEDLPFIEKVKFHQNKQTEGKA